MELWCVVTISLAGMWYGFGVCSGGDGGKMEIIIVACFYPGVGFGAWTWRLDGLYELIGYDTLLYANGMNELHIMI